MSWVLDERDLGVVTEVAEFTELAHDLLDMVHFDDTLVVMIADSNGCGSLGEWRGRALALSPRQIAACTRTGLIRLAYFDISTMRGRDSP